MSKVTIRELSRTALAALLDGERSVLDVWHREYPMVETFGAGRMTLEGAGERELHPFGMYQILFGSRVVGDIAFHGPPADQPSFVEIGYHVVPGLRGQGIALAACLLIMDIAWAEGVDKIIASTEADNLASKRVLLKSGFEPVAELSYSVSRPRS